MIDTTGQTRVYQSGPVMKTLAVVFSVAACAFFVFLGIHLVSESPWMWLLIAAPVGFLVYTLLGLRVRLTLAPDRFEYQGRLAAISGMKNQLAGYREWNNRGTTYFIFKFKAPDTRSFTVADFGRKPGFREWLSDLPDLNKVEREAYETGLRANEAFGSNPADRARAIGRHRIFVIGLNGLGAIAAGALIFLPDLAPYDIALLLGGGFLALSFLLVTVSGGRYALTYDLRNPRLSLALAAFGPSAALGFRCFLDDGNLDKLASAPVAAACGGILALAVAMLDRPPMRTLAWAAAGLVVASWGMMVACNRVTDKAPAVACRTVITDAYMTTGRNRHPEVGLEPWGPADMPTSLRVSREVYDRVAIGDEMCITLHTGALHYRWLDYKPCALRP